MNMNMYILKFLVFSVILFNSAFSSAAVKFYQSSKVHNNGSISITFTYSAKESELKNNMAGNLPFNSDDARQFFYSPDSEIKKCLTYKDPTDNSIISVTVDIDIRDINKIPEIKGLNNFKTVWMKRDTGMVFSWLVPVSFIQNNFIDTYQFILAFEDKVRSSNGVVKDNNCNWYVYADKINPGGAYFVATVNATESNSVTSNTSGAPVKPEGDNNSEKVDPEVEKPKTCGVFSVELPIIIFSGLIFFYQIRRKKNQAEKQ